VVACSTGGAPRSASRQSSDAATPATTPVGGAGACRTDYTSRPLPAWAQAGFTPPSIPMPYVLSDRGDIVAILWATHDPLVVPPAADRNNKILWVSRVGWTLGASLQIHATAADRSATRTVAGGPGPSIIDLPAPGCWSLDLTWGNNHDHLDLGYAVNQVPSRTP
jgi:hypothetical protein